MTQLNDPTTASNFFDFSFDNEAGGETTPARSDSEGDINRAVPRTTTSLVQSDRPGERKEERERAQVMAVALDGVVFSNLNPRSAAEAGEDLIELIRSFGTGDTPLLAQLPTGELLPDGRVRLLSGERRVRALQESGRWSVIEMVIHPANSLSPSQAHRFRVVENLHRRDLNEFDEAAALKISYLLANAQALGAENDANRILSQAEENGTHPPLVARELEQLMEALPQWSPTRPPVNWETVLDGLGIALEPSRRRQKLRVLDVVPELHPALATLPEPLSEIALRELGRLGEADQAQLVAAIVRDPHKLADKVVAIVKAVREKNWSVEQALTYFLNNSSSNISKIVLTTNPSLSDESSGFINSPAGENGRRSSSSTGIGADGYATSSRPANSRGRKRFEDGDGWGEEGEGDEYGSGEGGYSELILEGVPEELPPQVADRVETLQNSGLVKFSEPALRSLAQLTPDKQHRLLDVLEEQPQLATKLVRIIKIVRDNNWSIEAAIAELTHQAKVEAAPDNLHISEIESLSAPTSSDWQLALEGEQVLEGLGTEELLGRSESEQSFKTSFADVLDQLQPLTRKTLGRLNQDDQKAILALLRIQPEREGQVGSMAYLLSKGLEFSQVLVELERQQHGTVASSGQGQADNGDTTSSSDDPAYALLTQEEKLQKGIDGLIQSVDLLSQHLTTLRELSSDGQLEGLPRPFDEYTEQTLGVILTLLRSFGLDC